MAVKLHKDIQILVVDEQPLTQNYLRYALETLGYPNFKYAENSMSALALCAEKSFDLIICSFNLNGKDGYQLYQELKVRNMFRHGTGFIFISAETDPSLVHSVLELQPDEFMVKPFAIRDLQARISRTVQRKKMFSTVLQLMDKKDSDAALKVLNEWLEQNKFPRYTTTLLKMKGDILLDSARFTEAEQFYSSLIHNENYRWVDLGLARCLLERESYPEAKALLQPLLNKADLRLAALDLLAEIHLKQQRFDYAQHELLQATGMAPRNLLRQQKLLQLSRLNHDYECQFKTAKELVRFARFSIYEQPDLYLNLARASIDYALSLNEDEQTSKLSKVANDSLVNMRQLFPDQSKEQQQAVIQARIYYLKDQIEKAKKLLLEMDKVQPQQGAEDLLDKAKALHEVGLLTASRQLFRQLNQDDIVLKNADPVFIRYLQQEQQERDELPMGPREFNNNAVRLYERGQWQEALHAFIQAFKVMPGNAGIALNLLQSLNSAKSKLPGHQAEQLQQQCISILSKAKLNQEQEKRWQQLQTQQQLAI